MDLEVPRAFYKGYLITQDLLTGEFGLPGVPGTKTTFKSAQEASGFIELKIQLKQIPNRTDRVDEEN